MVAEITAPELKSKLALTICLPSGAPRHVMHLSTHVDGDFKISQLAVGIDRNDAAQTDRKAGGAVAHVQATAYGGWLKAIAVV